jgi:hypothetical protein
MWTLFIWVQFEALVARTAAKNTVAWDMTLCSLEEISFLGTCNSEILKVGIADSSKVLINVYRTI